MRWTGCIDEPLADSDCKYVGSAVAKQMDREQDGVISLFVRSIAMTTQQWDRCQLIRRSVNGLKVETPRKCVKYKDGNNVGIEGLAGWLEFGQTDNSVGDNDGL